MLTNCEKKNSNAQHLYIGSDPDAYKCGNY